MKGAGVLFGVIVELTIKVYPLKNVSFTPWEWVVDFCEREAYAVTRFSLGALSLILGISARLSKSFTLDSGSWPLRALHLNSMYSKWSSIPPMARRC